MKIPGTTSYVTLHKTILKGFNAELMRWRPSMQPGGVLLRGFGLRFMAYRTRETS